MIIEDHEYSYIREKVEEYLDKIDKIAGVLKVTAMDDTNTALIIEIMNRWHEVANGDGYFVARDINDRIVLRRLDALKNLYNEWLQFRKRAGLEGVM